MVINRGDEKLDRKEIYNEVEAILDHYCNGCFLYKQNRKDRGRNFAHRFCISSCTVGEKIKQCGEKLTQ
jgi:hypothetical protein